MITIYHNPRCSKSRNTLALLEENGIQPSIIRYLDEPPTASTLQTLIKQLGITPRKLLRTGEDAYKTLELKNPELSDKQLIEAMVENPKLIERPIVSDGKNAVIGRPPENILPLIKGKA